MYSVAVARHALTQRSKNQRSRSHGYENRCGRMVASDACSYGRCRCVFACRYDCLCFLVATNDVDNADDVVADDVDNDDVTVR